MITSIDNRILLPDKINTINPDSLLRNEDSVVVEQMNNASSIKDVIDISDDTRRCKKFLNAAVSLGLGIGMGFASMPIFTDEFLDLRSIGIDVHGSEALFVSETINTFTVFTVVNTVTCYYMLNKTKLLTKNPFLHLKEYFAGVTKKREFAEKVFRLGVTACSGTFTNTLLWGIELHNRSVVESTSFDEYIGYALACTIPVFVAKALTTYDSITKKKHMISANTPTDKRKTMAIALSLLSTGGRYFAYSYTATEFCKILNLDDTTSLVVGNVVGGVLGNVAAAIKNYYEINHIFRAKCKNMNKLDFMTALVSTLEGMWFSLPTITMANKGMSSYGFNEVLKDIILAPLFGATLLNEAKDVYESYANGVIIAKGDSAMVVSE